MTFETIIERQLECLHPDGCCQMIRLRIGRPYPVPGQDWCCPVAVDGWHGELGPIHGIDSWQALLLALRLLEELLATEVERGSVLHWPPEEGQVIGIAELFQGLRKMRESTAYQAILDEGRAEGRTEEARQLVFRLGRKRWGDPEATVASAIKAIKNLERLELLAESVNDVASWQDLLRIP